tara:strand:+ start:46 stop:969 length:924 start_codon:yes stop_codon:yes gene_type:complete
LGSRKTKQIIVENLNVIESTTYLEFTFKMPIFEAAMNSKLYLFWVAIVVLGLSSCVPRKKMVYLQSGEGQPPIDSVAFTYNRDAYKLQVNDIVDVKVFSPEETVNEYFNVQQNSNGLQSMNAGVQSGGDLYYMTGFSISDSGNIILPVVGSINAAGLTIIELKDTIAERLNIYLKEYHLEVKLGGIRFTALGEFNSPGKYVLLQNQATIYEAIAQARDLSMVASRNNIKLIRQYPDGTRVHTVNLLDQSIISSPFYFIQPNDVIYVEPLKVKSWGVGVTGAQTLTTILSVVSSSLALIIALNTISNN